MIKACPYCGSKAIAQLITFEYQCLSCFKIFDVDGIPECADDCNPNCYDCFEEIYCERKPNNGGDKTA